jgi:threonine/homoserine/homoserine lactone efflux protein
MLGRQPEARMLDLILSFPPDRLLAFLAAGIVLNLTPGADVAFATGAGLAGGARAGAVAGLGVGLGGLWHVVLAAVGVSALIAAHPGALTGLKLAGAGYLAFLAWKSWTAARAGAVVPQVMTAHQAVWRGFVTNALNPKVILFILAFLPQFTDPALGPVWQQILYLGALFTLTGTAVTAGYGALAGWMGQALGARLSVMNRVAAVIFGGLSARLVFDALRN